MEDVDKRCPMIRMGVSGWVFLLVPAYPGSPGPKAVKRLCVCSWQKQDMKCEKKENRSYHKTTPRSSNVSIILSPKNLILGSNIF